ncbi:MAG: FAD-dependent oxidoreductase [Gammaproteobacteria bacterium]|nr:FAD-dependent oxidoreductase [Gammaproteobacteria bacterium]
MATAGTPEHPLRIAIIGAGPAGFYAAAALLKAEGLTIEVDMYDRLPTPFGLVRAGVAPDHQKDKSVTRAYDKSARDPHFRFCGNIEYGRDLDLDHLKRFYHQIIFATGTQSDRALGIPGEDLPGSHSATDFVAWYNGHPDYARLEFDLSCERVAVVGLGNVALDVARILCKSHEELRHTDIADHALLALKNSRIREVHILGRRGPAQAAFTPPEIIELGELDDTDILVRPEEATLDGASVAALGAHPDRNAEKNVDAIQTYAQRLPQGRRRQLHIRFLLTPLEIIGSAGRTEAIRLARNEPFMAEDGSVQVRQTGDEEVLPVGLVFRSVGYRGLGLPGLPFDERRGVIRNEAGRIIDDGGAALNGLYATGWIKRGPSGVIGSNKVDAKETVALMIEDIHAGRHLEPAQPTAAAAAAFVEALEPRSVSYQDWTEIDAEETRRGEAQERPRVKFTRLGDFLEVLAD